jgi:hypothetical protein
MDQRLHEQATNRGAQALRGTAALACAVMACAARLTATAGVVTTFAATSATLSSWQHVGKHLELLPRRYRWLDSRARHIRRRLGQLHAVDVARAVREDVRCADTHDELRACEFIAQRVFSLHRRQAVHSQPSRLLEVDKEQPHGCVGAQVADAAEHAVAVVTREDQLVVAGDADEAGIAPCTSSQAVPPRRRWRGRTSCSSR